jgi:DNA primase
MVMIPDEKIEEVRETADIVEVVSDYVKLKRSGSSYVGLCPFHDEKTPSFHVTPRLNIYKCFGCGASGDVFNFMMDMEGVGFVESVRSLADRYQVSLPAEDEPEYDEQHHLREGIYHALKFAGVYFHRCLRELDEAGKAREYLQKRGYDEKIIRHFGLGYAPDQNGALWKSATDAGIKEEYLVEAGLIKHSQRGEGFYDTFRGRLMFPIFNPSGKVIAFAGRILGNQKGAKYINSPQTKVYNKSEVVYAANFAKHGIRKHDEAIMVEGYTDVITLHQHDIKEAVATSGTSMTSQQMKLLKRYGDNILLIYDSDDAGQNAMVRGINIALEQGMNVKLLELPEGEDPDSFVKQFGKDSFQDLRKEESEDFVTYLVKKSEADGSWQDPAGKKNTITNILESIARIPDEMSQETYIQQLNQFAKVGNKALHNELTRIRAELQERKKREKRRRKLREERERKRQQEQEQAPPPHFPQDSSGPPMPPPPFEEIPHDQEFDDQDSAINQPPPNQQQEPQRSLREGKYHYEKELIRLMLLYGGEVIEYIGSQCNDRQFEHPQLKEFYQDIIERYKQEKDISVDVYAQKQHPYPRLVGEIVMEQYSISDRFEEKMGLKLKKDKDPYRTAKGALKALKLHYLERLNEKLRRDFANAADLEEKKKLNKMIKEVGRQRSILNSRDADELFPDPELPDGEVTASKRFDYKMKHERDD